MIRNASDATVIVPLIKEYLEVSVKNDDHLVKLTAIAQRFISIKQTINGTDSLLSDDEKDELLKLAESALNTDIENQLNNIDSEAIKIIQTKISNIKESDGQ